MDLNDPPQQAEFRVKVRAFLEEHRDEAPPLGDDITPEAIERRRAWQHTLANGGLAGVTWPVEHGGQGLGPVEQVIAEQEIQAAGVPGVLDFIGVGMLGPGIIAHGTPEQQERYLGPLLHGEEVWCQLFSEPAAGSDLAGIQSRARREDGGWRINGQKVWTTNAQFASFGLMLARTDPAVPKHKGLTMFIVPIDAEGVTVKPLRQVSGDAHFNEVFLDDVLLDASAVVGGVDNGWAVALTTLMFERMTISGGGEDFGVRLDSIAGAVGSAPAAVADPGLLRRLGMLATDLLALRYASYKTISELQRGITPGPEAGLSKITLVHAAQEAAALVADALGPEALAPDSEWAELTALVPGLKSAGGTEEILRNTVGDRVLGLPAEPRVDKGIPFAELGARRQATSTLSTPA